MSLVVVGLNHTSCPLSLREQLHFPAEMQAAALSRMRERLGNAGVVILSTCNRVEVYASQVSPNLCKRVRTCLGEWHGVPEAEFSDHLYEYEDDEAAGHLFRVTSGLDSLVLGENQILGQVHDAFDLARRAGAVDKVLGSLFQRAFAVAKEVRSETAIAAGKVSVGSVAVDLAASIFGDLTSKTVMIVGSGKMGELTLKNLATRGVGRMLMVNRSVEKARDLAGQYGGEALPLDGLDAQLHEADIVVASTAAPGYILRPEQLQQALKRREQEPMFLIDIAVPRNVDPACADLDNVYVYDVDGLSEVAEQNREARRAELDKCMRVVDKHVARFWEWVQGLAAEPMIVSMTSELHEIRERELRKTLMALPDLTDKQREQVAYLSKRLVNAILQRPMTELKREIGHHDPHTVLHLVRRLFGLKETA
ncbi:MAG: glutamyl-tRNA reductase [FCB group bacterium]|jgi:glutamyl-tRNA reductase|nr:glutamyl-tRNA reductase [FCB group bacterium]